MKKLFIPRTATGFMGPGSASVSRFFRANLTPNGGDGGNGGEGQEALLKKINENVAKEIEKRGYQDATAVQGLIGEVLKGLNLEALRSFDANSISESVRNIAGELEKVKNIRIAGVDGPDKEMVKRAIDKLFSKKEDGSASDLELLMRSKGDGNVKEIKLNLRSAVNMTTQNTIDENDYPQEMIESMSIGEFVPKRRGVQYIYDIADRNVVQEIEEYKTWLEEGDVEGAFAIVTEGAVKPKLSAALVRNYAKTKKAAGKHVVTEEFAKFRKNAYSIIKRVINDKVLRDYHEMLTTDLQAQAASYVGTTLDGTIIDPTDYHAIGAVAAQEETLNFHPDILIIHPQDKWRMALSQDAEGRFFMLIPMMGGDGTINLMGFRVITSTYQDLGEFTLGESGLFKIDEEPFTVRIGYGIDVTKNGEGLVTDVTSDFDTNQFRVIVEVFFRDYIATNHIGSFVTASFEAVKAALLAA